MYDELNQLDDERMTALENLIRQKEKTARFYDRRVKFKTFSVCDLVWKMILLIGQKCRTYGKWTPNWEGPFEVTKVFSGNAYEVVDVGSKQKIKAINEKYLKAYKPTMHELRIR